MDYLNKIENYLKDEISDIEGYIKERAAHCDFTGEDFDLFDLDMEHPDFDSWSNELREYHQYDLGAYHTLKSNLEFIKRLKNK